MTLAVTRFWGPFSGNDQTGRSGEVWLYEVDSSHLPQSGLLGSDNGERATVTLRPKTGETATGSSEGSAAVAKPSELVLMSEPNPGKYSGVVPLGDGSQLQVAVLVQDFIVWPILAVLAGAVVGGRAAQSMAWRRRRATTLASLKEALEEYQRHRRDKPAVGEAYDLHWPEAQDLPKKNQCPKATPAIVDPATQIRELWCALITSKGPESLDKLEKDVAEARTILDHWLELHYELKRLGVVAKQLANEQGRLATDIADLVGLIQEPPLSEATRQRYVARVRQLTSVAAALFGALAAWKRLNAAQWQDHRDLNPAELYAQAKPESERNEDEARAVIEKLAQARAKLGEIAAGPAVQADAALTLSVFPPPGAAISELARTLAAMPPRKVIEELSAHEIRSRLRRWDFYYQSAVALVTVFAYVLGLYGGHDFGQPTDYLGAIAAGLLGQVAGFALTATRTTSPTPA